MGKSSAIQSLLILMRALPRGHVNYVLHQADLQERFVHESLISQPKSKRFTPQVEGWLQTIIPDLQLKVDLFHDVDRATVKYQNSNRGIEYYIPTATGFGITYVLPIIVAGLLASTEERSIFVIENPEAHLHPLGQSRTGRFLAILACAGTQVIVETHSEHVVNGARLQLAQMNRTDIFKTNFFYEDEGEIHIKSIIANRFGELSSWPQGFFDQEQKDLRELLGLRRK